MASTRPLRRAFAWLRLFGFPPVPSRDDVRRARRQLQARTIDDAILDAEQLADAGNEAAALHVYELALHGVAHQAVSDPDGAWFRRQSAPIARYALLLERHGQRREAVAAIRRWQSCCDPVGLPRTEQQYLNAALVRLTEFRRESYPRARPLRFA